MALQNRYPLGVPTRCVQRPGACCCASAGFGVIKPIQTLAQITNKSRRCLWLHILDCSLLPGLTGLHIVQRHLNRRVSCFSPSVRSWCFHLADQPHGRFKPGIQQRSEVAILRLASQCASPFDEQWSLFRRKSCSHPVVLARMLFWTALPGAPT